MYRLTRPSDGDLDLVASGLGSTQPTVDSHRGLRHDRWQRPLPAAVGLDTARLALQEWRSHRGAGARVRPGLPPTAGMTVAVALRAGPLWVVAPCRVTTVVDEPDRYGFTYATLPGHPERGEESFLLTDHGGVVEFTIEAWSRPADILAMVGWPVSRYLQHHAAQRYLTLDHLGR